MFKKFLRCILECSDGEYGENCSFTCSNNCYNNEICDPFFGNCSKCADGFQNLKCNESTYFFYEAKRFKEKNKNKIMLKTN